MSELKTCTRCGETKPLSDFSKHRRSKDGHAWQCKSCNAKRSKAFRHTPSGIYTILRGNSTFFKRKPIKITREDFVKWYENQPKQCVYCGIREGDLSKLDDPVIAYSHRLTVDCKDNYAGYKEDNMVLACLRCNYLKQDFLSFDEMMEVAEKYVAPKWREQLEKQKANENDV